MTQHDSTLRTGRHVLRAVALTGLVALVPHDASAHFVLEEPASWAEQDALGSPQKLGPCGEEGGPAPTGEITAYQTGDTITVTINETIFHPGHYRIALATNDRSELPPPPIVTAGSTPCGSVPIQDPPVFPVLADGVLVHTEPFSGPQTFEVTLPEGVTCTHCTLQVVEFMSNHGLDCFYYHCADLSISDVPVEDGGAGVDAAAATDSGTAVDSGAVALDSGARVDAGATAPLPAGACACTAVGSRSTTGSAALAAVAAVGLVARRRRRR